MVEDTIAPLEATDTMAEAGRKILYRDFVRMLAHEAGSRTGEDIEDVHQMRVATRRMRSALRILRGYYKNKAIERYARSLRTLARRLGDVRDLDILILNLEQFAANLSEDEQATAKKVINRLDKKRRKARRRLNNFLDSDDYRAFIKDYEMFLNTPGRAARNNNADPTTPHQVRHVLPTLIYEYLGTVRAFDTLLEEHTQATENGAVLDIPVEHLHQLRIAFKRLRYLTSYFDEVLGASAKEFIKSIKKMQDYLGYLNDISVAQALLDKVKLDEAQEELVYRYLAELREREAAMVANFPAEWEKFNTRTVQQKLSNALLVLR